MKTKFTAMKDLTPIGLVMRFESTKDTTVIAETVKKGLEDCSWHPHNDFFKDVIYREENFKLLFSGDSAFISRQPTLFHLRQILVINTHIIEKKDDKGKSSIGVEFLGKWITIYPVTIKYTFYYSEKINPTGVKNDDIKSVLSYLSGQILKKLCVDIHQYISKTK